jgi:ABC-type amino acid transport substrate-binding protein
MSRLLTLALLAAPAAVLLAPPARAADEPKDIIAKAIKAQGGAEFLAKHKAARIKSKGKLDVPGVGEADYTQEVAYMLPDKFRDSLELSVAGQKVPVNTLVNGDKVSIEVNGKAIELGKEVKGVLRDVGHVLQVGRLVTLKDKKYELNIIGEDKLEGKKVVGVRVSSKGHKDVSLYFYADTHLLAKVEYRTADVTTGNEVNEERIIAEYGKGKGGRPVPKSVIVKRDGKKLLEAEVTEYELLEKIDDGEFTK